MLQRFTLLSIIGIMLGGCVDDDFMTGTSQMGYKPVYAPSADLSQLIKSTPAQPLKETGKIYTKGNLILVNRPNEGIHVIDNSDPAKPVNVSFLQIPGNIDVAMRGNYLFADYVGKIAVIDVTDFNKPRVTQQVKLNAENQNFPPADMQDWGRVYFECPDPSKGVVIGWTYTSLKSPKCWRDAQ